MYVVGFLPNLLSIKSGISFIGPGLLSAFIIARSLMFFGFIFDRYSFILSFENWKMPVVAPCANSLKVFSSSSGILSIVKCLSYFLFTRFSVLLITFNSFSPRKSILISPASSSWFISYCVQYTLSSPVTFESGT